MGEINIKIYAYDIDECLWTSNGPITETMLRQLRSEGHILGICGNLSAFLPRAPGWHEYISVTMNFDFGYVDPKTGINLYNMHLIPKAIWLHCFQHVAFPDAEEYVMVGNVFGQKNSLGIVCGSRDNEAAAQAGWRFIDESSFAAGAR